MGLKDVISKAKEQIDFATEPPDSPDFGKSKEDWKNGKGK